MAAEARRRCGFRKIGGTYLVSEGAGRECGRFPIEIRPCGACGHTIPFARGLMRIKPSEVLGASRACHKGEAFCGWCPLGGILDLEWVGLNWVGEQFYSAADFLEEASTLGISRRVANVPKWAVPGETWVLTAHIAAFRRVCPEPTCVRAAKGGGVLVAEDCETCGGKGDVPVPGVVHAFRLARIERMVASTATEAERAAILALDPRLTLVDLPADDHDHR